MRRSVLWCAKMRQQLLKVPLAFANILVVAGSKPALTQGWTREECRARIWCSAPQTKCLASDPPIKCLASVAPQGWSPFRRALAVMQVDEGNVTVSYYQVPMPWEVLPAALTLENLTLLMTEQI